jgi:tRNA dimethylallyltransferase
MGHTAFILVGPTASGKSDVALRIAADRGWCILAADSMVVYRGMDIGTAKPTPAARAAVPHDGLDLVPCSESFSAGRFRDYALDAIARRAASGCTVMVVGGTGLYVKALVCGLGGGAVDGATMGRLRDRLESEGVDALARELDRIDPAGAAALRDRRNPRRVARALERAAAGTAPPAGWNGSSWKGGPAAGLWIEPDVLRRRVAARAEAMFRGGLIDEVRGLLAAGSLSETAREAIGYAEAIDFLGGRCTLEEAISRSATRTCQLAKRQRTWFRHQMPVRWIDATGMDTERAAAAVLVEWRANGPTEISTQ